MANAVEVVGATIAVSLVDTIEVVGVTVAVCINAISLTTQTISNPTLSNCRITLQ